MNPLEVALNEYGIYEWAGKENNPRILQYFKDIGQKWVKEDATAWCAAFVNWCLVKAGRPQTGALNARSFMSYGESTKTPELGDIVVLWRENKDGTLGHVGFYINETKSNIYILGGNQRDQVNILKFSKEYLLDYRKIPEVHQ